MGYYLSVNDILFASFQRNRRRAATQGVEEDEVPGEITAAHGRRRSFGRGDGESEKFVRVGDIVLVLHQEQ